MRYLTIPILIVALASSVYAQHTFRFRYGLGANFVLNTHSTDFRALPGVPNCCPQFTEGTGSGFGVAGLVELPLSQIFYIGARLGYMDHSVSLEETESTTLIVGGASTPGEFTHTVDASIGSLGLEPRLGFRLFDALTVSAGMRVGTILSKTYEQKEVTSVGTFMDTNGGDSRSAIRNQSSGDIPETSSMLMHAVFGIGYELPLNAEGTTYLVPEVAYNFAVNDVVKDLSWKSHALAIGVSVKFSPIPPIKPVVYDTIYVRDTITKFVLSSDAPRVLYQGALTENSTVETDVITKLTTIRESYVYESADPSIKASRITATGLDDEGNEMPVVVQRVEEFMQTHAHPLLSYVFFTENSSAIPDRYENLSKEQAAKYDPKDLFNKDDIEIHRNILNIIGHRLRANPAARITVTGCNSDVGSEKSNLELSHERAEAVRSYLTNIWSIDASRIRTESRNLPQEPSSVRSPDGIEENQRVEITSDNTSITDVYTATDTTRIPTPPQIRFRFNKDASSPIVKWQLEVAQQGTTIKTFDGTDTPPDFLDWDLANDQKHVPRFTVPLDVKLHLTNDKGAVETSTMILPTDVRTLRQKQAEGAQDMTIDKFNLVLFIFNRSDITSSHSHILNMVKNKITANSQITIEGYTDRTGNPESNLKLAVARAVSAAEALGQKDAKIVGIGDKRLLYPNDTPEGRFHCRTVQIRITNPAE